MCPTGRGSLMAEKKKQPDSSWGRVAKPIESVYGIHE